MRSSLALAALGLTLAAPALLGQSTVLHTMRVASGLARPVFACSPPGDTDRLFIAEQHQGDIHILDLNTNTILGTPFLDLTGLSQASGNEQGFLGMAFHPDYASNGYFYVNYTVSGSGATRVARYQVSANPNVADAGSAFTILQVTQPQSNHNAGMLDFGPDGMLWIAMGDGGNFNDQGTGHATGGNAQSGATLLGKMLRIDVDGGSPYAIPSDNPYVTDGAVLDEIWAFGLRNPFRHSFDSETGDLWIGDVGQDAREELNFVSAEDVAGVAADTEPPFNFGWRCQEGLFCTSLSGCTCNGPTLTLPITQYNHGTGVSIIAGRVYRGDAIPDLAGTMFYADHYSDIIWRLRESNGAPAAGFPVQAQAELAPGGGFAITSVSAFGVDGAGELYLCDLDGGEVFKLVPEGPYLGLGASLDGANGKPIHFGTGGVAAGQPGALHLRNAAPNAIAGVFLSLAEGAVAFKGGILKTVPLLAVVVLNTDANGSIDLPWSDTGGAPSGAILVSQYGISDAGAPAGVALSNALRTTWP